MPGHTGGRPRTKGRLYRQANSRFWWAKYWNSEGKRIRESTGTDKREEAEKFLKDRQAPAQEPAPAASGSWQTIPGQEGFYEVSIGEGEQSGSVRSLHRVVPNGKGRLIEVPGRVLRPSRSGRYLHVTLSREGKKTTVRPHQLVAEIVYGPCPEGMEVGHLNNIRTDNRPSNLAYVTPDQNKKNARRDGLYRRGKDRYGAKLTDDDVRIIRGPDLWPFRSEHEMALHFHVSDKTISRIRRGERWAHVQDWTPPPPQVSLW
jgi:hypothetical protein